MKSRERRCKVKRSGSIRRISQACADNLHVRVSQRLAAGVNNAACDVRELGLGKKVLNCGKSKYQCGLS